MPLPDVVGYPLRVAAEKLAQAGCRVVSTSLTGPEREGEEPYVVRQREVAPQAVAIIVAYLGKEPCA